MNIAIPRETLDGEQRVALVPDMAKRLAGSGVTVRVEQGAGVAAGFPDALYTDAGAEVVADTASLWGGADIVAKIQMPRQVAGGHEVDQLREGATLIGLLQPHRDHDAVRRLAGRKVTAFSLDLLPRITRAQSMDVLSSMSTVTGYKAVHPVMYQSELQFDDCEKIMMIKRITITIAIPPLSIFLFFIRK